MEVFLERFRNLDVYIDITEEKTKSKSKSKLEETNVRSIYKRIKSKN